MFSFWFYVLILNLTFKFKIQRKIYKNLFIVCTKKKSTDSKFSENKLKIKYNKYYFTDVVYIENKLKNVKYWFVYVCMYVDINLYRI